MLPRSECARLIAKEGHGVMWHTPLGLPVVQPYRRKDRQHVRTLLQVRARVSGRGGAVRCMGARGGVAFGGGQGPGGGGMAGLCARHVCEFAMPSRALCKLGVHLQPATCWCTLQCWVKPTLSTATLRLCRLPVAKRRQPRSAKRPPAGPTFSCLGDKLVSRMKGDLSCIV